MNFRRFGVVFEISIKFLNRLSTIFRVSKAYRLWKKTIEEFFNLQIF